MLLDLDNKIEITTTEITTTSDGAVAGIINNSSTLSVVLNDNIVLGYTYNGNKSLPVQHGIPKGSKLKLTANNTATQKCWFIPYIS